MANVLWALPTQINTQQGVISFDLDVADRPTLGKYVQNYTPNYISPEKVQWLVLHVVAGCGASTTTAFCTAS